MHGAPYYCRLSLLLFTTQAEREGQNASIQYIFWGGRGGGGDKSRLFRAFYATMPLQNRPTPSLPVFEPVYSMTSAGTTPHQKRT